MVYSKLNLPPGTVVYTGIHKNTVTHIEVYSYSNGEYTYEKYQDENFYENIKKQLSSSEILWINVIGLNKVDTIKKIGELFEMSPLVLEDVVHISQRSKVEISERYLFSIYKMVYLNDKTWNKTDEVNIVHEHLSIILTKNAVVTFQEKEGDVFDGVRSRITNASGKLHNYDSDYLYYTMLDALVDHQLQIMSLIADDVDAYEDQIVSGNDITLEPLYKVRKELLLLKSSAFPFKDIIASLHSSDSNWISDNVKEYLGDVNDHVNHVYDQVMLYREMVNNIYEMHMLDTSNNLNQVMTVLTIFSAIFIPLSFLAGFFGMNFKYFPGLSSSNGIIIFIASCIAIATGMLAFFKSKKWL